VCVWVCVCVCVCVWVCICVCVSVCVCEIVRLVLCIMVAWFSWLPNVADLMCTNYWTGETKFITYTAAKQLNSPGNEDSSNWILQLRLLLRQLNEQLSDQCHVSQAVCGTTTIQLVTLGGKVLVHVIFVSTCPADSSTRNYKNKKTGVVQWKDYGRGREEAGQINFPWYLQ